MDFVQPLLGRTRSESFYLRFSKLSTVFWAAALILVAYLSREVVFVLNAAFSLRGLTSGALLGGVALVLLWRRGNSMPVVTGMLASLLVMIGISLNWFHSARVDWPWFTLIGTIVTLGVAWLSRWIWPAKPVSAPLAQADLPHDRTG
jgi:Na+/proline symporter